MVTLRLSALYIYISFSTLRFTLSQYKRDNPTGVKHTIITYKLIPCIEFLKT